MIAALKTKLRQPQTLAKIGPLLDAIDQHVDSDLTTDQKVALARFVHDTPREQIHMDTLPSRQVGNDVATDWDQAAPVIQKHLRRLAGPGGCRCGGRTGGIVAGITTTCRPGGLPSVTTPLRVLQVVRPALGGIRQHVLSLLDGLDPALVTLSVAAPPAFVREVLHSSAPALRRSRWTSPPGFRPPATFWPRAGWPASCRSLPTSSTPTARGRPGSPPWPTGIARSRSSSPPIT